MTMTVGPLPPTFNPNLLTNPGFEVWQRGAGPFTANLSYSADRWQLNLLGTGTGSISQETTQVDASSGSSLKLVWTTAASSNPYLAQKLEDYKQLRGRVLTLTFRVYCTITGAVQAYFTINTPGGRRDINNGAFNAVANQWTTVSVTGLVDATATDVEACLNCAGGTSFTCYVDNAVLVAGIQPIPYAPFHPADDLLRCQRYYERLGNSQDGVLNLGGYLSAGNQTYFTISQKARKAVTPTLTVVGAWNKSNTSGFNASNANPDEVQLGFVATATGFADMWNGSGMYATLEANP